MAQLEQWVPAEELASGIGTLLAEEGLSSEAKVEQIKAYAAQMGIPITEGAGKNTGALDKLANKARECLNTYNNLMDTAIVEARGTGQSVGRTIDL